MNYNAKQGLIELIGFAVYSSAQLGYLKESGPGLFITDIAQARLFKSKSNAQRSAKMYAATVVELYRDKSGLVSHRPLNKRPRASAESWLVIINQPTFKRPKFVKSLSHRATVVRLTSNIFEARGFTFTEAEELTKQLNKPSLTFAEVKQLNDLVKQD